MATRRTNGVYYVKRSFKGVGPIYKTLNTKKKTRALARERVLEVLHQQGRLDLIRSFGDGGVSIDELESSFETGNIPDLSARLRREDVTLAEACRVALRLKAPDVADSSLERYTTGLEHFQQFVGEDVSVRDALTDDKVQEFKGHRLAQGVAEQTVNNDMVAVSVLVSRAMKKKWIEDRPEIKQFDYKARIRWLDSGQLASYMATLRPAFRVQMQLLVGTGMRLGETEALRVRDLRLSDGDRRAMVEDSKTTEGVRSVFLPEWVTTALREHIEDHDLDRDDPVFTIPRRTVQQEHARACKLAGLSHYTIHDHRHTAAVHLAKAGMPLNLLQTQLGHKHISMTMKYAAFHPDYSDVSPYFDTAGAALGLGPGNKPGNTHAQKVPVEAGAKDA